MERDPSTPGQRIRWAIEQSGRTLEQIADEMECTHSTLSQWQTGKTNVFNIKAGLLVAFSRITGASIDWVLTGNGPRLSTYPRPKAEAPLVALARHIASDLPEQTSATAYRLLEVLEAAAPWHTGQPPDPKP